MELGHAGHRNEFSRPQHVPAARRRRDLDDRAGGMGTVTQRIADAARKAGATIETNAPVVKIAGDGVVLQDGRELRAKAVLVNADPFGCKNSRACRQPPLIVTGKTARR